MARQRSEASSRPSGSPGSWATLASRIAGRLGLGPTIAASSVVVAASVLLIPLASVSLIGPIPLLAADRILEGFSVAVLQVVLITLQQGSAPAHLQGRLSATISTLFAGAMPAGSLIAGALGAAIGLRRTIIIGAAGMLLATLWVLRPSVRGLREPPSLQQSAGGAA